VNYTNHEVYFYVIRIVESGLQLILVGRL